MFSHQIAAAALEASIKTNSGYSVWPGSGSRRKGTDKQTNIWTLGLIDWIGLGADSVKKDQCYNLLGFAWGSRNKLLSSVIGWQQSATFICQQTHWFCQGLLYRHRCYWLSWLPSQPLPPLYLRRRQTRHKKNATSYKLDGLGKKAVSVWLNKLQSTVHNSEVTLDGSAINGSNLSILVGKR